MNKLIATLLTLALVGIAHGQTANERRASLAARAQGTNVAGTVLSLTVTGETSDFSVTTISDDEVSSVSGSAPTQIVSDVAEQAVEGATAAVDPPAEAPAPAEETQTSDGSDLETAQNTQPAVPAQPVSEVQPVVEEQSVIESTPPPMTGRKTGPLPGKGKEVCLVGDITEFDNLVAQGFTVTAVTRYSRFLVQVTRAFRTKTTASRVTIRGTGIPKDVMELCNVSLKDLGIREKKFTNTVLAKSKFSFTSKSESENTRSQETRKRLKKLCAKLFGKSFEGVKEQCQKSVDEDYLDEKKAELEAKSMEGRK